MYIKLVAHSLKLLIVVFFECTYATKLDRDLYWHEGDLEGGKYLLKT